jgi:ubiquinone/menaquinone biosynthesis C-methylase UbiE
VIDAAREQASRLWAATPCGTGDFLADFPAESREYFDAARRHRYEVSDPWMNEHIDFASGRGCALLEIGVGIGSDLLTWAENGAIVHGVDITDEHLRLTSRNFMLHGMNVDLRHCDAAHLEFPDETFDIVYSNGVLHHIPEIDRCIGEARRVLRPGGRLIFTVYHRHSLYHWITLLLYRGLMRGELRKIGYDGLLATIEHGADGVTVKPFVQLYSLREVRALLSAFSAINLRIAHFTRAQLPAAGFYLPRFFEPAIARRYGWYIVAEAVK